MAAKYATSAIKKHLAALPSPDPYTQHAHDITAIARQHVEIANERMRKMKYEIVAIGFIRSDAVDLVTMMLFLACSKYRGKPTDKFVTACVSIDLRQADLSTTDEIIHAFKPTRHYRLDAGVGLSSIPPLECAWIASDIVWPHVAATV